MKKLPLLPLLFVFCLCTALPSFARSSISKFEDLGNGTLAYTRQASTGLNRDTDKLTEEAKEDASRYCQGKGKQLKIVSIAVDRPWYTFGYSKATVVFQALEAGDPALSRNEPVPVITNGKSNAVQPPYAYTPPPPAPTPTTTDLYNDLMKLDELRQKGILTDDEFQAEKKKLLSRSK